MNETTKLLLYFLLGGTIVAAATYCGSKGNGLLASFISMFPSMSVLIFLLIYQAKGEEGVAAYAKGFLLTVPPWILYVLIVYFLYARIGVLWSLALGVGTYIGGSWAMALVKTALLKK